MRDEKKKQTGKTVRNVILSLLLLVAVVLTILVLIQSRDDLSLNGILNTIRTMGKREERTERFEYTSESGSAYAALEDGLVVVSGSGVQVLSKSGEESLSVPIPFASPAVYARSSRAAAYDIGGNTVCIFDRHQLLLRLDSEQPVIAASVNENGWTAVATQEKAYVSSVTAYNASGTAIYKWYSGGGYVLDAEIFPDNSGLAAAVITEKGSDVVFFRFNSEAEQGRFSLDDTVILDIRYINTNTAAVIADTGLYLLDSTGKEKAAVDFRDRNLVGWSLEGEGFLLLAVSEYQMSSGCRLIAVSPDGETLAEAEQEERPTALSAAGDRAAVLYPNGIRLYDKTLTEIGRFSEASAFHNVLVRKDGDVFAVGLYSAVVCRIRENA